MVGSRKGDEIGEEPGEVAGAGVGTRNLNRNRNREGRSELSKTQEETRIILVCGDGEGGGLCSLTGDSNTPLLE